MIRVLIKTASAVARAGLEALFRAHGSIEVLSAAAETGPAGQELDPSPDIILVELKNQEDELARDALDWASNGASVIVLVPHAAADWIAETLRAGVKAVLPARLTGPEIAAAIEAVFAGLIVLHPGDLDLLVSSHNRGAEPTPTDMSESLTSREIEVLQLLTLGLANK